MAALALLSKPQIQKDFAPVSGGIVEILGPPSSGRTTMAQTALAQSTREGRIAAVVDVRHAWNPMAAAGHGADLERILWIRCQGDVNKALQATDLILRAGGFGLVWLDLDATPAAQLSRIPLSYWYRFRRTLEPSDTALVVLARQTCAGATAHAKFVCEPEAVRWSDTLLVDASFRIRPQKSYGSEPSRITACMPA